MVKFQGFKGYNNEIDKESTAIGFSYFVRYSLEIFEKCDQILRQSLMSFSGHAQICTVIERMKSKSSVVGTGTNVYL